MELGIFIPIANNGWILSKTSPQYMPSFDLNRYATVKAEEYGFDFALSMVKWRGYGGETEFWDHALESMSLMAGLAAVTNRIELYASVQPLTMNPAVFARMAVTIDDISGGRFGINLVAGWNKYEYEQMGLWPGDEFYDDRYAYAQEWLEIVKGLWAHGRLTYRGRWLSAEDCLCQPRPSRMPPIVCAGISETGMRFTARNGNASFIGGFQLEGVRDLAAQVKRIAAEEGTNTKVYVLQMVIAAPTDKEAADYRDYMNEGADHVAIAGMAAGASNDKKGSTAQNIILMRQNAIAVRDVMFIGSYDTVADRIATLERETNVDGLLLTFPDFRRGIDVFGTEIMPRLRERGVKLKQAPRHAAA